MVIFKYYFDITKYNLMFFVVAWLLGTLPVALWLSATLGMFVSLWVFRYFQQVEYYFYRNAGWSKGALFFRAWLLNAALFFVIYIVRQCFTGWK